MTYGHLQADCLYIGISSEPNARYRVWKTFTFTFLVLKVEDSPRGPHSWRQWTHTYPRA